MSSDSYPPCINSIPRNILPPISLIYTPINDIIQEYHINDAKISVLYLHA